MITEDAYVLAKKIVHQYESSQSRLSDGICATIKLCPPAGFWYSKMELVSFIVKVPTSKSDIYDVEGFAKFDADECLIVTEGEFIGNCIVKSHVWLHVNINKYGRI